LRWDATRGAGCKGSLPRLRAGGPSVHCRSAVAVLVSLVALGSVGAAADDRFIPADDAMIVERLRERPLDRIDLELRSARTRLRAAPTLLPLAQDVAERSIAIARRDGDPRYLGYAAAALAPWFAQVDPPTSVRLLRATLLQSVHQFQPALDELDEVLRRQPREAQAWLTRASILQVLGRYTEAEASCQRLPALGAAFYAEACLAELSSLTGHPSEGHARLIALRAASRSGANSSWLSLVMAEMEERAGDFAAAEVHFREALAVNSDAYTKAAYADFLLDRGRASDVIMLLEREQRADPLLLRLALAYRAENRTELAAALAALQARFDAARLRGDRVHLREEARFELALRNRPLLALPLAIEDWSVQKEPADARIVLESATAAGEPEKAAGVIAFLRANRVTDQRLAQWLH
jgi:tetratricopeptide (TPR) repeat protein